MASRGPAMIVYESAPGPVVRVGEHEVAGRRIVARAIACGGEVGPPAFRFDPVDRRFVARRASGPVACGPADPDAWADAISKTPPGLVVVEGSAGAAEEVRGSFRAAAEGARLARRGAYLLDPPAGALPGRPRRAGDGAAPAFVLLGAWSPDAGVLRERLASLEAAASAGIPGGLVWPLFPGWTDAPEFVRPLVDAARGAGAAFAVPVAPSTTVEARRTAVEARTLADSSSSADAFFDTLFHTPWEAALAESLEVARRAVRDAGLPPRPPRPAPPGEPLANTRAAARLEDLSADARDEHRAARLLAAARWIDACGRDLGAIRREGNLTRAFPLGAELAADVERALEAADAERNVR
jgi:hypothetical protein